VTGQTVQPPRLAPLHGDAISQLVQLIMRNLSVTDFKATGKGDDDITAVVKRMANAEMASRELWKAMGDFVNLLDATPGLPESLKAVVSLGILRARGNAELSKKL
jgi:hypothetical protein